MANYERENLRIRTDDLDNTVALEITNPAALSSNSLREIVLWSISNTETRELVIGNRNEQQIYISDDTLKLSKSFFDKKNFDKYVQNITKLICRSESLILRKPQNKLNP